MITPPAIPPRNPASRALPVKNALHAKSDKVSCRVAIIGAGLAGLSAADHLVRHGIEDIVVLEARQRVGGRIHTVKHNGKPLELGSQWIHGGCPANSVFNLANRFKILGREVQRLHEETEDSDGENVLKHWPTAKGYIYKPDGLPMSCSASNHAYEIFNNILEEAEQYNRRQYQKQVHPDSNQDLNRILKSTRMSTFYNGRKRRALESLRKTPEACSDPGLLTEVELALSGLARVFSVESGDDLCKVRLEMVGAKEQLPGGHVMVPKGLSQLVAKLSETLPKDCIKLGHVVKAIDWSLLSRDPKLPDKVTVICKNPGLTTTFNADYVICTIPIGVLKENHDEVFHPKLPSNKVQAIQNIGSGQMGKILLEWQSPWWAPGEGGIQLAWPESSMNPSKSWSSSLSRQYDRNGYQNGAIHNKMDDEYRRHWYRGICNFSEVESQPNLLMCLIAGESSRIADELDDEEVIMHYFSKCLMVTIMN